MLSGDIAGAVGGDFVDGPLCGGLGWAGGGEIVPSEAADVEGGAVGGGKKKVGRWVGGCGSDLEDFARCIFAVKFAVGQVDGEGALGHLRGGRHSACDIGSLQLDDGHFKFLDFGVERWRGINRATAEWGGSYLEAAAVEADAVDAAAGDGDVVSILRGHRAKGGCCALEAGDAAGEG